MKPSLNQVTFTLSLDKTYELPKGVLQLTPKDTLADVRQKIRLIREKEAC